MESLFPGLFFLSFFAATVLRVFIAAALFLIARRLWHVPGGRGKVLAGAWGILGALFLVGLFVQLAAITGIVLALAQRFLLGKNDLKESVSESLLLIGVCIALLILGAGAFAFDVPY